MSTRSITLEYDKTYFSIIEGLAANYDYGSVQDFIDTLVAAHVFDALEDICGLGNSMEFEKHNELAKLDYDDGIPS